MLGILGILVVILMVFGGYLAAGGKLDIILAALPFEMMIILGAATGAFLIANDQSIIRSTLRDMAKVFRGPRWKPDDYRDLLCLLFTLIRLARQNPVAIESHIEQPETSDIFARYPKTMASIDQPPEVLGKMIGGALVGTFLGVFLAYGFVGPFSVKVRDVVEEDAHFYRLIREVLIANMHNHPANMCIEVGRQNAPLRNRPSFSDLENALKKVKQDAA